MREHALRVTVILAAVLSFSCHQDQLMNDYFKKLGLNRLAVLRTDIEPGGLVVGKGSNYVYADHMLDYLEAKAGEAELAVVGADATSDYVAILKQHQGTKEMAPGVALKFLSEVLPVDIGGELSFTASVYVSSINAKVRRLKVSAIQKFLREKTSTPFRKEVRRLLREKKRAFLIYETYRTNKLRLESGGGTEITASINVGEHKILGSGQAKLRVHRTSKSVLEIEGSTFYVFAVRTARLKRGSHEQMVGIDITEFVPPKEWGIKAAGGDERFSAPLAGEYKPVVLQSGF